MTYNRNILQKFATLYGTYLGLYWAIKFILLPLGFSMPILMLVFFVLTLFVPFIAWYLAKTYRDKCCYGVITFGHACLFTIFMYMFAALLTAVVHYTYFQFIDQGYFLNSYTTMVKQFFAMNNGASAELAAQKQLINEAIKQAQSITPIDITMQMLSWNVLFGSIISFPTALFVMRKDKGNYSQTNNTSNNPQNL